MDSLRSVFIVPIVAGGLGVIFTLLIKNAKFQAASKKDPSKNSGTGKDGDLERVSPKDQEEWIIAQEVDQAKDKDSTMQWRTLHFSRLSTLDSRKKRFKNI